MGPQENSSVTLVRQSVIEEQNFSGALFGFKRREVLDYVRSMSEQNETVVRQLDDSIRSLNGKLEDSRQKAAALQEQIDGLQETLEAGQAADEQKRLQLEELQREYSACKEALSGKEAGYQQLQQKYADLRAQKEQADSCIRETQELLQTSERRLAEETARRDAREEQMKVQFAARLKSAAQDAQSRLQMAGLDASRREEALRKESEEENRRLGEQAESALRSFSSQAAEERERLAHHVEQVDAQLNGLKAEMEQVQRQIWAAHAMIRQTTQDMNELLARARENGGFLPPDREEPEKPAKPVQPTDKPASAAEKADAEQTVKKPEAARPAAGQPTGAEKGGAAHPTTPRQPASQRVHPAHSTVRSTRETVSDHLLDALGRLWQKK